jgi:hypothetical protein
MLRRRDLYPVIHCNVRPSQPELPLRTLLCWGTVAAAIVEVADEIGNLRTSLC